jgi:hypothetical protein
VLGELFTINGWRARGRRKGLAVIALTFIPVKPYPHHHEAAVQIKHCCLEARYALMVVNAAVRGLQ